MPHLDLLDASLDYVVAFFCRTEADLLFAQLLDEIDWRSEKIVLFGKEMDMPRLSSWVGDTGASYTYSRRTFDPSPWTPTLSIIRSRVVKHLGTELNSCLCNLYRTGQDSMGWHSDDEPELGTNPTIASISLGEPRRFLLRHRHNKSLKHEIVLGHGSLLVMSGATQANWQHSLPKSAKVMGPRLNLTFRKVEDSTHLSLNQGCR